MTNLGRPRGAVGVIVRRTKFLVIQRSVTVRAPGKFCFPGGSIEPGETEQEAVVRELAEEINLAVQPLRRIWQSETPSGIELNWWQAALLPGQQPQPNPAEVADFFWMSPDEMIAHSELLPTNREFLLALQAGQLRLSSPS